MIGKNDDMYHHCSKCVSISKYYLIIIPLSFNQILNYYYDKWNEIVKFENGSKIFLGELPIIKSIGSYVLR
jgi:hypothetical protein